MFILDKVSSMQLAVEQSPGFYSLKVRGCSSIINCTSGLCQLHFNSKDGAYLAAELAAAGIAGGALNLVDELNAQLVADGLARPLAVLGADAVRAAPPTG